VKLILLVFLQVFPTEFRTLGSSLCVSIAILANAANAELYNPLLNLIGIFY
jgi:hypothetical protein